MVTNPVDPLTARLAARLGDAGGSWATRSTTACGCGRRSAASLGVPGGEVEAWVLGEHGDRAVPIFSRVRVDGEPVTLDADVSASAAADFVRGWYRRHVALDSGRSSTWTSGAGVARMVAAIVAGAASRGWRRCCWTASTGSTASRLGVPVALGPARRRADPGVGARRRRARQLSARAESPAGTRCARASPSRRRRLAAADRALDVAVLAQDLLAVHARADRLRSAAAAAPRGSSP